VKQEIGLVGIGTMGAALALNFNHCGWRVAAFDLDPARVDGLLKHAESGMVASTTSLADLVSQLDSPRAILLMVNAGKPVDAVLDDLLPLLSAGDVVLDAGNSHFRDTERRQKTLKEKGVYLLGVGVSGGEEGALHGPSIMVGGEKAGFVRVADLLEAAAAKTTKGDSCMGYFGTGGAGHYIKMVHNGIEYGIMQAIAETYDLLQHADVGSTPRRLFAEWSQSEIGGFLLEITSEVLSVEDPETGKPLVDLIRDRAKQKGTGQWTSQHALEMGVPVPSITAAVDARNLSARSTEREVLSKLLPGPAPAQMGVVFTQKDYRLTLHAALLTIYDQGFAQLAAAKAELGYTFDLAEVARIWRGGCIIRSRLLDGFRAAFLAKPELSHLLESSTYTQILKEAQTAWRGVVASGIADAGLPLPVLSSSLAYYDALRSERLPANLIQAQRDYFGAHTYERIDKEGVFHTDWANAPRIDF
jgi:6-phosphogluconate dehydrogenase